MCGRSPTFRSPRPPIWGYALTGRGAAEILYEGFGEAPHRTSDGGAASKLLLVVL
jgi:hypothetical protein